MRRFRSSSRVLALVAMFAGMLPFLAACGASDKGGYVTWASPTPEAPAIIPARETATPAQPAGTVSAPATEIPTTPEASAVAVSRAGTLSPRELLRYRPNEIGWIPVIEYHIITTDSAKETDQFVRTAEHMRADLQFLYDHDFYVIPMRELVRNEITAPAGKHPVVLTFDDSTASQFRWDDVGGKRVVDPNTAIGVLETFFADHPDFGRGGFFAVLPFNCFADDTPHNTMADCTDKLTWMAERGYEIGLHTQGHHDLLNVPDDRFREQIGENAIWVDARVQGPGNLSGVIAMPFGNYPDRGKHPGQRQMMREGFTYKGEEIRLEGALMVGANPTESPASATFDPLFIARIQAYKESLDLWFPKFVDGTVTLYTSDGNPDVIAVPSIIPQDLHDQFDPDVIGASGKLLVHYDADTGKPAGKATTTRPRMGRPLTWG